MNAKSRIVNTPAVKPKENSCEGECLDGIRISTIKRLVMDSEGASQVYEMELYEVQRCDVCEQYDSDKLAADAVHKTNQNLRGAIDQRPKDGARS